MRILHVAETIKGGIATYFRELVPHQVDSYGAQNVALVVPESQIGELGSLKEIVSVVGYDDSGPRWKRSIRLAIACLKFSKRYLPDILHVHSTYAGFSTRPVMRLLGPRCKIVYCAHGWAWDRPSGQIGKTIIGLVELALSRLCEKVICISDYEYRAARRVGFPESRLAVVKNGISVERQLPSPVDASLWPAETKVRLLFVGRLDRQKGVDILIDAVRQLGQGFHLVIAGDVVVGGGVDFPDLSNCSLTGWVNSSQLETLYSQADILVVPSRWEGFGLVAIEGMRAGLPVIVSDVGALPEIVDHGVTGVVFRSESVAGLIEAVRKLVGMDLLVVGEAGCARFKREFSVERLHAQLSALYSG